MDSKKALFVIHKILRVFSDTLTVNDNHYLPNRDKLTQPIQAQLSQKLKDFSSFFFFAFLKSILNFKHLPKKMSVIADVFKEIPAPKNMAR